MDNRPRTYLLAKAWRILFVVVLALSPLILVPTPGLANGAAAENTPTPSPYEILDAADCGSSLGQVPWDRWVVTGLLHDSSGTLFVQTDRGYFSYSSPGVVDFDCNQYFYVLITNRSSQHKTYFIAPEWYRALPAEVCDHSAIDYSVFVRRRLGPASTPWILHKENRIFGWPSTNPPIPYDHECIYAGGDYNDFGNQTVTLQLRGGESAAVVIRFWSHNHTEVGVTDCYYEICDHPGSIKVVYYAAFRGLP